MKHTRKTTTALVAIAAAMITPQSADAALLAHWTFDEASGTSAADSSASGLTATTTAATTWITGVSGNAALNPKFTLADSSSLALANGNTAFTISLWAKQTTQNSFAVLAGFEGVSGTGDRYAIKTSGGNIQATVGGATAATSLVTAGPDGTWLHIVAVNDPTAGNSKVYVNGTLDGTGSVVNLSSTTSQFTMGTYWNSNSYDFNGALDDVQVYDEALGLSDVQALNANPGLDLTNIPEPSTTALLGLGGLALILRRRK